MTEIDKIIAFMRERMPRPRHDATLLTPWQLGKKAGLEEGIEMLALLQAPAK